MENTKEIAEVLISDDLSKDLTALIEHNNLDTLVGKKSYKLANDMIAFFLGEWAGDVLEAKGE
jgi:hypothetical protein